jgi:hypothetical protein
LVFFIFIQWETFKMTTSSVDKKNAPVGAEAVKQVHFGEIKTTNATVAQVPQIVDTTGGKL